MKDVICHSCTNGLSLLIWSRRDAELVAIRMGVETGSSLEAQYAGSGISHLLEHMVFKGTTEMTAAQLNEGVSALGGLWNAYTGTGHTVFQIDGPSRHARAFIRILVQLTLHPTFPEEEWERERDVIRREMEMYADDPEDFLQRTLAETLYHVHPRRFPVIGLRGVFDSLRRDDVLHYHAERYVPGNMFLCVVGDVEAEKVIAAVEEEMRAIPARACPHPVCPAEPLQRAPRICRREFPQPTSSLCLAWRTPSREHEDIPALSVLGAVLGSGRAAWLQRIFHDERALAHDTAAYLLPHAEGQGAFIIRADVDTACRDTLRDALVDYAYSLPRADFADALARVKKSCRVQQLKDLSTITSSAEVLASTWASYHHIDAYDEWNAALRRVTEDDLRRVAALYLIPHTLTEVSVDPLSHAPAHVSSAPQASVRPVSLPAPLPTYLVALPQCPLVHMVLAVGAGCRAESAVDAGISALMAEVLPMGTTTRNSAEVAEATESVGASLQVSGGNNSILLSVRCLPEDAPSMLSLLADVALHPAFDARVVQTAREDQLAEIREEMQLPAAVVHRALRSLCFGDVSYGLHPLGTEESVSALTPDMLHSLHRRLFCRENAVLALVGDVQGENLLPALQSAFADMPVGSPLIGTLPPPMRGGERVCSPSEPTNQAAFAVAVPGLPIRDPAYHLLTLLDEWCSDMAGPLYGELRESRGLVYHVGSELLQGVDVGALIFSLETSPEHLDAASSALRDTLDALAQRGISLQEFRRAQATALSACLLGLQSPARRAAGMALDVLFKLGADYAERTCDAVRDATFDDMQAFVKRILASSVPRCAVSLRTSLPPSVQS